MGQEDTGAQAEPEGQEYIDRAYEYWEALEENDMLAMAEDEAEAINRELNILDLERMVRENGEKPAAEWTRTDFKDLLHQYPRLRHWRTRELRAVFLNHVGTIDSVDYYKRLSMMEKWERLANGGPLGYEFTDPAAINKESEYTFERRMMEVDRLWRLYHRLQPSTSCLLLLH